jgi:Fe-S-cluster containining protein
MRSSLLKHCSSCDSRCCKYPIILPKERERIIKHKGMGFLEKRVFRKRKGYYVIEKDPCPFLKDNRCVVEEVKPSNCRIFPLVFSPEENKYIKSGECPVKLLDKGFVKEALKNGSSLLKLHKKQGMLK